MLQMEFNNEMKRLSGIELPWTFGAVEIYP